MNATKLPPSALPVENCRAVSIVTYLGWERQHVIFRDRATTEAGTVCRKTIVGGDEVAGDRKDTGSRSLKNPRN
ncbi:unnamed protein product [Lasius platythorax]|uniref:Uncharacterized protein n=1 Tax=Lasius platythorax TaxID=488582 RepID=A0AAV2P4Q5_9HYME